LFSLCYYANRCSEKNINVHSIWANVFDSARLLPANILAEEESVGELLGEFKHNVCHEYADLYVKRGGWIKAVNQAHLPILKLVRMSAIMVSLEKVSNLFSFNCGGSCRFLVFCS
jgi:hypothetical protein